MKIRCLAVSAILAVMGFGAVRAEEPASAPVNAHAEAVDGVYYSNNDFDGLWFQLPVGISVEKGSEFKALYPDGSFGVSMVKLNYGATRKISVDLCKRAADSFHIPRSGVKKVTFGKARGAEVSSVIEGKQVHIIVLPYQDHQIQIVVMADPSRQEWVNQFLSTLKQW